MASRAARLKKLVDVQAELTALCETRHANLLAAANAADGEARELSARFDAPDSLAPLFADLYNRRIAQAIARREENLAKARQELQQLAVAKAREKTVMRAWREARAKEERQQAERDGLEMIENALARRLGKAATSLPR